MTHVLVVCKTRMYTGLCLGGLTLGGNDKIRLLTPAGNNQPVDTPFDVGDVWNCVLEHKPAIRKPHTEDMLVMRQNRLGSLPNARRFLLDSLQIQPTHKSRLFAGLPRYTEAGSAYISEWTGLPDYAHEFWRPMYGLRLQQREKSAYYYYEDPDSRRKFRLRYVGLDKPVPWLAPGSLLHLSLARWWRQPGIKEERCYLQLSGWFL